MSVTAVPQSAANSACTPVASSSLQNKTSNATAQPHTQADAQMQSQVNMQMEGESRKDAMTSKDGHQTPPSGVEEAVQPSSTSHINTGNG